MLRKFLYPRNSTRKKDAFLFILLLFLVTYLAINYLNLMSFSKSFKDAVIETDDSQIKNKLIIRGRELSNRDKSIDTKKTTKPKDKINTEDARKERPVKQQDNKDQGDKKTRLYAIDHSGLGDNSRLIDCSSSLEVELVPDNVDKANFSYYLNGVPPGVENRKQLADGKRHYYMVFAMESEPHSGGGDSWKFGDFHMWYNLDKSFPEPATYFDVRSYLPDLLAPPRVEFEQKETSAPVVWILSNCHAFNQRERFVQKLMNLIKVDSFGGCLNNNRKFSSARMQGNVEVYSKYKFVITIENSNCEDYVTEKLVFSVASGSIPIVAGKDGKPNYLRYLPKGSYINVYDFKTVEDLVKHLNLVGSSKEEYEKYFAFKRKHNYTREYLKSLPLSKQIELGKQILGESDDTKQFFEGLVLKEKSENKVCKVARYLHETPREKVEEDIKANRMNRPSTSEACLPAGNLASHFSL